MSKVKTGFKQLNVDLGEIAPGGVYSVRWEFDELSPEDLHKKDDGSYDIRPGCGCTAEIEVDEKGITAKYTDKTKLGRSGVKAINKDLHVYLTPEETKNSKGVLVDVNPSIRLTFIAVVKNV